MFVDLTLNSGKAVGGGNDKEEFHSFAARVKKEVSFVDDYMINICLALRIRRKIGNMWVRFKTGTHVV